MNENTCVCCGETIPEGRQVCWGCEHKTTKVGSILQSQNAPKELVEKVYDCLFKSNINDKTVFVKK